MLGLAIALCKAAGGIITGVGMILGGIKLIKDEINTYRTTRGCPA